MNILRLKNGSTEAEPLVRAAMASLSRLFESDPIAFFELVSKARDRSHQFFGNTGDKLKALALVDGGGGVHDSLRNIVLSAVSGEMLEMRLGNPVIGRESRSLDDIQREIAQNGILSDSPAADAEKILAENGYVRGEAPCSCPDGGEFGHRFVCGWVPAPVAEVTS